MPAMHSRKRVFATELEAIENAAEERERYLRIAETLEAFRDRLRTSAETLDAIERQKVLRSLVTEVLVGDGEITIRHPIPMTEGNGCSRGKPTSNSLRQSPGPQSYLLRWVSPRLGHSSCGRQLRTRKHIELRAWLARHPRFGIHITPTYSS